MKNEHALIGIVGIVAIVSMIVMTVGQSTPQNNMNLAGQAHAQAVFAGSSQQTGYEVALEGIEVHYFAGNIVLQGVVYEFSGDTYAKTMNIRSEGYAYELALEKISAYVYRGSWIVGGVGRQVLIDLQRNILTLKIPSETANRVTSIESAIVNERADMFSGDLVMQGEVFDLLVETYDPMLNIAYPDGGHGVVSLEGDGVYYGQWVYQGTAYDVRIDTADLRAFFTY